MNDFFPKRLKMLRVGMDLTQKQLAEKAKISVASVSAYEKGDKTPPLNLALRIAVALNVSLDWMCGVRELQRPQYFQTCGDMARAFRAFEDSGVRFTVDRDEALLTEDETQAEVIRMASALGGEDLEETERRLRERKNEQAVLKISAPVLARFFEAWKPIRAQYQSGIIDDELYGMWLDKQITSLNAFTTSGDPRTFFGKPADIVDGGYRWHYDSDEK